MFAQFSLFHVMIWIIPHLWNVHVGIFTCTSAYLHAFHVFLCTWNMRACGCSDWEQARDTSWCRLISVSALSKLLHAANMGGAEFGLCVGQCCAKNPYPFWGTSCIRWIQRWGKVGPVYDLQWVSWLTSWLPGHNGCRLSQSWIQTWSTMYFLSAEGTTIIFWSV